MGSIEAQPFGGEIEDEPRSLPHPRESAAQESVAPAPAAAGVPAEPAHAVPAVFGSVGLSAPPGPAVAEPEPDPAAGTAGLIETSASDAGSDAPAEPASDAASEHPHHRGWSSARRQISTWTAVLGWLLAAFLLGHRYLPGTGGAVPLLETWLPWFALPVGALFIAAVCVRSPRALLATVVAMGVWLAGYGPQLLPRHSSLTATLRVYSVDINNSSSHELEAAGRMAMAQNADLVALSGVYPHLAASTAPDSLNHAYKYRVNQYEFGVWSRYPITATQAVSLGTVAAGQDDGSGLVAAAPHTVVGALRVVVATPQGPLTVYLVHLPEPVIGDDGFATQRDAAVQQLVATVAADKSSRLAIVGDVDVSATDRYFTQLSKGLGLTSAQAAVGAGFGFTWPAEFPVVRLDDVLSRGAVPVRSVVLPKLEGGQSHLPIEVDLHV